MSAILATLASLFLNAFGEAVSASFAEWLRQQQSAADAQAAGRLTAELAAAQSETELLRDSQTIERSAAALSDAQAKSEALTWASS